MIFNTIKSGTNTKDATITPYDVSKDEIGYGVNGKVVGDSPFWFNGKSRKKLPSHVRWKSVTYGNGRFVSVVGGLESASDVAAYLDYYNELVLLPMHNI